MPARRKKIKTVPLDLWWSQLTEWVAFQNLPLHSGVVCALNGVGLWEDGERQAAFRVTEYGRLGLLIWEERDG